MKAEASIRVLDSITSAGPNGRAGVIIAGSHGGRYSGYLAACARPRGVMLSDAGVGLNDAGIASLAYLEELGIPAAAVDYRSARIGDGADLAARGRISYCNRTAERLGCTAGMTVAACAELMFAAEPFTADPPPYQEARTLLRARAGEPDVWGIDSNSLVRPEDAGAIVVTGSHGGLLGGRPETALRVDALAAVYNDAGVGIDDAGVSRLLALQVRGIAAVTVDCRTARIGDSRSSWETGRISFMNAIAQHHGATIGMTVPEFADRIAAGHRPLGFR